MIISASGTFTAMQIIQEETVFVMPKVENGDSDIRGYLLKAIPLEKITTKAIKPLHPRCFYCHRTPAETKSTHYKYRDIPDKDGRGTVKIGGIKYVCDSCRKFVMGKIR